MTRPCWRDEDGLLGGLDALAFGALVFLTGTLLILNAWSVVDTRMAVSAAAREAVRTVVEAPAAYLSGEGAVQRSTNLAQLELLAVQRAGEAIAQHGKDVVANPPTVRFAPLRLDARCAEVVVTVSHTAPTIALPFVGVFRDGITVTIEHRGRIDPYRAGLAGEVDCG